MASSTMKNTLLPSQETNNPWIYVDAPDTNINTNPEDFSPGKWMIFNDCIRVIPNKKITYHDYAWQCIQKLVSSTPGNVTGLHRAKCSTAWTEGYAAKPNSTNGVICCYTRDFSDKHLAKTAADAIRKVYHHQKDIFYKTDEDTYANKYGHLGSKYVSIYKHTIANDMFERDSEHPRMWNLVSLES